VNEGRTRFGADKLAPLAGNSDRSDHRCPGDG
jgi:hypothetical protein